MSTRKQLACALLAVALVTFAAHSPSLNNGFVNWDDNFYVTDNPHVQAGFSWDEVYWAASVAPVQWHPLTWLSLQFDWQLFSGQPWGFHLVNLLLHVANSVLLVVVLWQLTGCLWPSFLAGLLFALHPLQVQSVAWVTERKNVLATLFWLLTMGAYAGYARRPGFLRYGCVCGLLLLGLLAKSTLVTLPLVLLLLDFWPLGRLPVRLHLSTEPQFWQRSLRLSTNPWVLAEKLPLLALAGMAAYLTYVNRLIHGYVVSTEHLPMADRLRFVPIYYCQYLGKTFWPVNLSCYYPHERTVPESSQVFASLGLLLLVTLLAACQARQRPYLLVGWLWFLGTLVPSIGLVQVGGQGIANHFVYVPLIGIFIMLAWTVAEVSVWGAAYRWALVAGTAVVVLACATWTWQQTRVWHDSVSLWEQASRVTDGDGFAGSFLCDAYLKVGRYPEAFAVCERYLERYPYDVRMRFYYSQVLKRAGRPQDAEVQEALVKQLLQPR
jgi:hypothetical protein